jgi:hypothetical protein
VITSVRSLNKQQTPEETSAILLQILRAVQQDHRKRWVEVTTAMVLSLATVGSAWCVYQSARWSGVQTFHLSAAAAAGRKSTEAAMLAMELRTFDAQMLISYLEAEARHDERMRDFLLGRFRPEMNVATVAWLKTDPFNSPTAPKSPFKMDEYKQPETAESEHQQASFEDEHAKAQQANKTSDTYVLLTVLFASVLFFAGTSGTFNGRRVRLAMFVLSLTFFALTLCAIATMPICKE